MKIFILNKLIKVITNKQNKKTKIFINKNIKKGNQFL